MNGKPTSLLFNHPGGERVLNSSEIMNKTALWNSGKHSRKYVEAEGEYLSSLVCCTGEGHVKDFGQNGSPLHLLRKPIILIRDSHVYSYYSEID